jgi:acyl-coenzyme A thioesterase PaaI-like protein
MATARHLHEGRSTHVISVDIERGDGRRAAHLIVTQFILPPQSGGPGESPAPPT